MDDQLRIIDQEIANCDGALLVAKSRGYDIERDIRAITEQRFRLNELRKRILAEQAKQQQKQKEGGGDGAVGNQPHQG